MNKELCPHCFSDDVDMYAPGWIQGWMICRNCGHKFQNH